MGLNTKHQITARFFEKWITVGKLKSILNEMDDDLELLPNAMGNLNVCTKSEYKGFIDISTEIFEDYKEEDYEELPPK